MKVTTALKTAVADYMDLRMLFQHIDPTLSYKNIFEFDVNAPTPVDILHYRLFNRIIQIPSDRERRALFLSYKDFSIPPISDLPIVKGLHQNYTVAHQDLEIKASDNYEILVILGVSLTNFDTLYKHIKTRRTKTLYLSAHPMLDGFTELKHLFSVFDINTLLRTEADEQTTTHTNTDVTLEKNDVTIRKQILAALDQREMTTAELLNNVKGNNTAIKNELARCRKSGHILRVKHGVYTRNTTQSEQ